MFSSMLSLLGSLRGGSSFITNSLRFRSSASAYLSRTPSVAGNRRTFTWSGWVKRGTLNTQQVLFGAFGDLTFGFGLNSAAGGDGDYLLLRDSGSSVYYTATTGVFRDVSAWYHIVLSVDTNLTASDRVRIYVNGIRQSDTGTPIGSGVQTAINNTVEQSIGRRSGASNIYYFDGYLTDVNFIDGQALTPVSFGAIDSSTGVWAPRPYSGTYGTNGFYLKFANTSSVAALGNDSSGNNNTWTVNNVSLTAGATYDSMIDVPVNYADGGNNRGNYAVLNPLDFGGESVKSIITDGNLKGFDAGSASFNSASVSTIGVTSGKFYCEFTSITSFIRAGILYGLPISSMSAAGIGYFGSNGIIYKDNVSQGTFATYTTNDVIGLALDADAKTIAFYKNNTLISTISYTSTNTVYFGAIFANQTNSGINANFGQRPFQNTTAWTTLQAAGFRALNTNNLPTPSIVNGANFMAATTYTGNAAARSLSNAVNSVSFQPDLVWIKNRTAGTFHALFDSARGATRYLSSNTTALEALNANTLTAFTADGFSLGNDTTLVNSGTGGANSYVAWQWKESVAAGLDVVTYTGTGVARTVAHNLGVAPKLIIVKGTTNAQPWPVFHALYNNGVNPANYYTYLNSTNGSAAASVIFNNTAPTSSVFSIGTDTSVNQSTINFVAYCFAEIAGFSKFGSYTGNGSVTGDGPFVFCGFRPRFVMIKRTDVANDWRIFDVARNSSNVATNTLFANSAVVEETTFNFTDILSNGFKPRTADNATNASGGTYIFAAFAENPSKYALAR